MRQGAQSLQCPQAVRSAILKPRADHRHVGLRLTNRRDNLARTGDMVDYTKAIIALDGVGYQLPETFGLRNPELGGTARAAARPFVPESSCILLETATSLNFPIIQALEYIPSGPRNKYLVSRVASLHVPQRSSRLIF